jgi:hypothetical protein
MCWPQLSATYVHAALARVWCCCTMASSALPSRCWMQLLLWTATR